MRYEQNHILPQKTGTRAYGIVKGFQKVYLLNSPVKLEIFLFFSIYCYGF